MSEVIDAPTPQADVPAAQGDARSTEVFGIISGAIAETLTPEFIEKQVTSRVEKLICNVIDESLRPYGAIGKVVSEAVNGALQVNDLNLPTFSTLITGVLEREVKAHAGRLIEARLVEDMQELLGLAPAEIKLSKIAEMMLESDEPVGESWGRKITVLVEESDSSRLRWIYLHPETLPRNNKHLAKYRMLLREDGTIACATLEDRDLKDIHYIGKSWGLGDKIRAWYASGTKIILDEDDVITSNGDF